MPSAAKKLVVVSNDDPPPNMRRARGRTSPARSLAVCQRRAARRSDAGEAIAAGRRRAEALERLKSEYANRGVNLVQDRQKWAFRTAADLSWLMTKNAVETRKLSRAAIETLAIIAYHQPVTRAEIEEIRGVVTSEGTVDVLLETGWIRPRGRRKAPGRPLTYGTTETFLSQFEPRGASATCRASTS